MAKKKVTEYNNLRRKSSHRPNLNTDRAKNSFFNHLIFNYDLALKLVFCKELIVAFRFIIIII